MKRWARPDKTYGAWSPNWGVYVLAIKPSARKRSQSVGEWVNREGARRSFPTKALAREWARVCARPDAPLWVQDAPPWDDGDIDGYLVGGRRARHGPNAEGEQRSLPDGTTADDDD